MNGAIANGVTVTGCPGCTDSINIKNFGADSTHVIVDVMGFFGPGVSELRRGHEARWIGDRGRCERYWCDRHRRGVSSRNVAGRRRPRARAASSGKCFDWCVRSGKRDHVGLPGVE